MLRGAQRVASGSAGQEKGAAGQLRSPVDELMHAELGSAHDTEDKRITATYDKMES